MTTTSATSHGVVVRGEAEPTALVGGDEEGVVDPGHHLPTGPQGLHAVRVDVDSRDLEALHRGRGGEGEPDVPLADDHDVGATGLDELQEAGRASGS